MIEAPKKKETKQDTEDKTHKKTRHVKKGRQTYVSLLTDMDVFPFLFGDANDRECGTFEVSGSCQ